MKVTKEYELNEVVWKDLNIGDSVQLPEFTVPETTIEGVIELHFGEYVVKDKATVYDIKDDKIYLIFNHALFMSAMDLNNATKWKKTQLRAYLRSTFKNAMRDVGVPVSKVSLLSKDEIVGLQFFKSRKNVVAFVEDESSFVGYWLKNISSASYFCTTYFTGYVGSNTASNADIFVRPCFVVKKEE